VAPEARALNTEPRSISLVRLAGEVARSLAGIGRVAVEGEVHRPTTGKTGWVYFTLRDRAAQIPVVCPGKAARRCRVVSGERVLVVGLLEWSSDRGQLSLRAEEVTPVGAGAIAAMIAEVRARLLAEGLIGRQRRPLPRLPQRIGVLCGADAAVRRDIESVVAARFAGYPLVIEETTVSGPGAALSIIEGLARLAGRPGVEVIILARGGGDATQLLPWSDEELCRAVAACPIPVVSAIGHEADRPLCDEVADLRCGTPSIAAHAVVPDQRALQDEVDALLIHARRGVDATVAASGRRLSQIDSSAALAAGARHAAVRLRHAGDRLRWAHPGARGAAAAQRVAAVEWTRSFAACMHRAETRLQAAQRHAAALSPQRVLERGFSVVRRPDGTVVRDAATLAIGDRVDVTLAAGGIRAHVEARLD
jgi:exodeoxyribonuclease VII large subunit